MSAGVLDEFEIESKNGLDPAILRIAAKVDQ
jgi:hypothetical protein